MMNTIKIVRVTFLTIFHFLIVNHLRIKWGLFLMDARYLHRVPKHFSRPNGTKFLHQPLGTLSVS